MSKVRVNAETGCWEWTDSLKRGYGSIRLDRTREASAHRVSYELHVGPIPDGLRLNHLCRVRHCVNPDHLEPVTAREIVLRGKGLAAENAAKTECPQGHPYDDANTYIAPSGGRHCRACVRAANVKYRAARLEEERARSRAYYDANRRKQPESDLRERMAALADALESHGEHDAARGIRQELAK